MFESLPTNMPGGRYPYPAERTVMAKVANTKKVEELFQELGEDTSIPGMEKIKTPPVEKEAPGVKVPEVKEPSTEDADVPTMGAPAEEAEKAEARLSVEDAINGLFQAVEALTTSFQNELALEKERTEAEKAKTAEVEKKLAKVRALIG
jgi:hypothetical protein